MNVQEVKSKGIKITKHKLAILELFDQYKHLDAHKIYSILSKQEANVSIATIYRVLSSFERNNLIIKHNFNDYPAIYELADPNTHHDHLICVECHKVIEFFDKEIETLQEQIATKNNFTILNHCLNLYGICQKCHNKISTT